MTTARRIVLAVFLASAGVAAFEVSRGSDNLLLLVLFAVPLAVAVIIVPGFFRLAAAGSLAGALVGLIVGGVGGRIAMGAAALMGGGSEVTVATLGVVFFGGILGAMMGLVLAGLQQLRQISAPWVGLITGTILLLGLLMDPVAWADLFHEGTPWVNLPMFFGIGALYGVLWGPAASSLVGRLFPAKLDAGP